MPEQLMQPRPLLMIDAFDHQVEIFSPIVDHVVAQQNLAEARAVGLHARIALVALDRGRAAEDHAPRATGQHGRADVAAAGINRNRLGRNARLDHRGRHAIGRPRLLRAGLEHQAHLHRNHRQPQRVHARRIRRQHQPQRRRLA